ncbi:MAG: PA4642 family protein [Pseudomonadales bacterium]|jgi:hypothetical protein|nr:PA4642 family protein [Pseudomonadales bacterium]
MASRRDKAKVIDEVWDDDRIRSFLARESGGAGVHPDHARLLAAYQGMRDGDFRRFLAMFVAAGGDVDARDPRGRSLADVIVRHRHAGPFLDALEAHGARAPAAERDGTKQGT